MDLSASAFSLNAEENARALLEQRRVEQEFREAIVSCRSLSHYEDRRFRTLLPQIAACFLAASFHVVVGVALAFSAILIPQLEDPESDVRVTVHQSSWIASLIVVAVPVGSIVAGFVMESVGRLNCIRLAALPGAIGWAMIATAGDVRVLIAGRLLTGLAAALGTSPAIVYITEVARPDMRGSLIAAAPTFASLGMVLAYLEGWYMSWRTVAWIGVAYTLVPALLVAAVPESPVWLVGKGRRDVALRSLRWLDRYQPQPENKAESMAELRMAAIVREHDAKVAERSGSSWRRKARAFCSPTGYKPMLVLAFLFAFQQFSGIYITLFYAVTFFDEVGSDVNPYLASILIGSVRLAMSMVNTWMLRRFRRRPLVMTSAAGMAVCMAVSGLYTKWIHEGRTQLNWVPIACLLLYVVTSMIGMLTIPWTMTAELFPSEIRGLAHSVAYSLANLLMFASVQSYRDLDYLLGGSCGVQWFFAAVSVAGLVYAYVFLPETHGKKLSEIQTYFEHNTIYLGQAGRRSKSSSQPQPANKAPVATRVTSRDAVADADVPEKEKMIDAV